MGKVISKLLFQPPDEPTYLSSKKYFWLTTSTGGKIPAFFIRQHHARFTILYSHGNAEDLGMIYEYLTELSELLYINILAYDYSGYGLGSRRKDNIEKRIEPSEENCYADIEAAFEYLTHMELISTPQIILYGRSVGSGPSCYLAQKLNANGENIAGLILHSPFLSVCRVVLDMGFEMTYDIFPNVSRIKEVGCPTFIMHGTKDEVVPFRHGKGLYDALPEEIKYPPFWAENMGHNNIETQMTSVFIKRLQKFFLQIRKIQCNHETGKENGLKANQYTTLETQFGITFSNDSVPAVISDSEDDSEGKSKLWERLSQINMKLISDIDDESNDDGEDEERSPRAAFQKLKSTTTFYRTVSPMSRDEIECLMQQSSSESNALDFGRE